MVPRWKNLEEKKKTKMKMNDRSIDMQGEEVMLGREDNSKQDEEPLTDISYKSQRSSEEKN